MTATMPRHVAALCAALDAGDDAALPILADALEEIGDPRARGLRRVGDHQPACWARESLPFGWAIGSSCGHLASTGRVVGHYVRFPTRSAAYLALATALTQED